MKKCSRCQEEAKSAKSPGWKEFDGKSFCPGCFREKFRPVSIAVPIAGPAEGEWEPLRKALTGAWSLSTNLANWCVAQLLKADRGRQEGDERLGKMARLDLYNLAFTRKQYPDHLLWVGAKGSASSVTKRVADKYGKDRIAVHWKREQSPAMYRYPMPWPVRGQDWNFLQEGGTKQPNLLRLTLPGGAFSLRLRRGPEFARQYKALRGVAAGEYPAGELKIYRHRCSSGRHRRTVGDRESGGGKKQLFAEMVSVTVFLPRVEQKGQRQAMLLATDAQAFWVANLEGRDARPWILNADHVRAREERHAAFLQRISEDLKPEKRWPKRRRVQINEMREARCVNHNNFVTSWSQEASAMLAKYAARQGVSTVVYQDAEHSYCQGFPWHRLRLALAHRLEADGIECVVSADAEQSEGRSDGEA